MEPVTHFLTGACLGRAGFNRKTAYATLVAVLAAEAADLDIFWGFGGPVDELKHHRGITHTFWAVPVMAERSPSAGAGSISPPASLRSAISCSTGPTTTACGRSSH